MWNNLEGLIEFKEQLSIQDIRDINKKKELPKRIRNKNNFLEVEAFIYG